MQSADTFYIIKNMACIERVQTSAHARLHLVQMGHDAQLLIPLQVVGEIIQFVCV